MVGGNQELIRSLTLGFLKNTELDFLPLPHLSLVNELKISSIINCVCLNNKTPQFYEAI